MSLQPQRMHHFNESKPDAVGRKSASHRYQLLADLDVLRLGAPNRLDPQ